MLKRKSMLKCMFWFMVPAWVLTVTVFMLVPFLRMHIFKNIFSDFADTLSYCLVNNPYHSGETISFYPPISFIIFWPLLLLCKPAIIRYLDGTISPQDIHHQPWFLLSYFIFFFVTFFLILLIIAKISRLRGQELFYFLGIVATSGTFIYSFYRGNITLLMFLFVLIFFWLYRSERQWHREIALICLAMSIAMKIFTVLLALILIKDRRWWALIRTGFYTILLIFVPFIFFGDNFFSNIYSIFINFTRFANENHYPANLSFVSTLFNIFGWFLPGVILKTFAWILKVLMLSIVVFVMFKFKGDQNYFYYVVLVVLPYAVISDLAYAYVLMLTLVVLLYFIVNVEQLTQPNQIFYGVCLLIMHFPLFYTARFLTLHTILVSVVFVKAFIDLWREYRQKYVNN